VPDPLVAVSCDGKAADLFHQQLTRPPFPFFVFIIYFSFFHRGCPG
jgi:hypothetical protein